MVSSIHGHDGAGSNSGTRARTTNFQMRMESCIDSLKFSRDYRASLPQYLSRFTGYRPIDEELPYEPLGIPPFIWLKHIPLEVEVWLFAWIGAFTSILLIEAIMITNTAFHEVYHSPIIITSFGASAVLVFGAIESPVGQPRNVLFGHFISALVGTCITRLFVLDPNYHQELSRNDFSGNVFVNGALSMATSLLAMLVTGTVHPPAGATGLNAAVESAVVTLSWRYLPVVLASALIMLGWAMIINNLGRRRYPMHWWTPKSIFVREPKSEPEEKIFERREAEEISQEHHDEGAFRRERIESSGDVEVAERRENSHSHRDIDREPADLEDLVSLEEGR